MNICILGAGAWGTAIALHAVNLGHTVTLVPRRFEHALAMATSRENTDYLPTIGLNANLQISSELAPAILEADYVIFACPIKGLCEWAERLKQVLSTARALRGSIILSKGLDCTSLKLPVTQLQAYLPQMVFAVLSGPTYAKEVAQGKPTAVVLAYHENTCNIFKPLQEALHSKNLRVYNSNDLIGVQLGGALKNIYALGAGMAQGLNLGDNAHAAYITRALDEMVRIAGALGANTSTIYGLSGLGDLVATCSGSWSRNRSFGFEIACGSSPEILMETQKTVVEGYPCTYAFYNTCQAHNIKTPILDALYGVLNGQLLATDALEALLARSQKHEAL